MHTPYECKAYEQDFSANIHNFGLIYRVARVDPRPFRKGIENFVIPYYYRGRGTEIPKLYSGLTKYRTMELFKIFYRNVVQPA